MVAGVDDSNGGKTPEKRARATKVTEPIMVAGVEDSAGGKTPEKGARGGTRSRTGVPSPAASVAAELQSQVRYEGKTGEDKNAKYEKYVAMQSPRDK